MTKSGVKNPSTKGKWETLKIVKITDGRKNRLDSEMLKTLIKKTKNKKENKKEKTEIYL